MSKLKIETDFVTRGADANVRAWDATSKSIVQNTQTLRRQAAENQRNVSALRRRREAQKEHDAAVRDAAAVLQSIETPQQKYSAELKRLQGLLTAGTLQESDYTAARAKAQQQYLRDTGAIDRKRDAQQKAIQVAREDAAVTASVLTPQERFNQKLAELQIRLDRGGISQETFNRKKAELTHTLRRETGELDREAAAQKKSNDAVRAAQAIIDRTKTANQRYGDELAELRNHLKAGRLTQEQFAAAVGESKARLLGAGTANKSLIGSLGKTAGAITGIGGAVGTVLTAVRLLKNEYEQIVSRQKGAAETTIPFEEAVSQATRNTVGVFTADETREESLALARDTGINPATAAQVVGETATAVGVQNTAEAQLALRAARAAVKFDPSLDAKTIANTGAIAGSLAKKLDTTPEGVIGFTARAGQQSNITDQSQLVQNLGPTVTGLLGNGARDEASAAALFTTLTQLTDDTEGELSSTAALQLASSLRKQFRDNTAFQKDDGTFSLEKAINYLQQNDEARRAFLDGTEASGFELLGKKVPAAALGKGRATPFIEQILTGGSDASRQYAQSIDRIGSFEEGKSTYRDVTKAVRGQQQVTRVDRALSSATERIAATNPEAISGAIREKLTELEKAAGGSAIGSRLTTLAMEMESDFARDSDAALTFTINRLQKEQARLTTPVAPSFEPMDMYGATGGSTPGFTPSARDREVAAEIGRAVAELREVLQERQAADKPEQIAVPQQPESFETARESIRAAVASIENVEAREKIQTRFDDAVESHRSHRDFDPIKAADEFLDNFAADITRLGGDVKAGRKTIQSVAPNVAETRVEPADVVTVPPASPLVADIVRQPAEPIIVDAVAPDVAEPRVESADTVVVPAASPLVSDTVRQPAEPVDVDAVAPNVAETRVEPADVVTVPFASPLVADTVRQPADPVDVDAVAPNVSETRVEPADVVTVPDASPLVADTVRQPAEPVDVDAVAPNVAETRVEPADVVTVPFASPQVSAVDVVPGQTQRLEPVTPDVTKFEQVEAAVSPVTGRRTDRDTEPRRDSLPDRPVPKPVADRTSQDQLRVSQAVRDQATEQTRLLSEISRKLDRSETLRTPTVKGGRSRVAAFGKRRPVA